MLRHLNLEQRYKLFCVYGGKGGVAKGGQGATAEYRGLFGACDVLGSIDVDEASCRDFEMWTGIPATQMDLFDAEQYRDWHGHEPPRGWREALPEDIRAAAQHQRPDIVAITAPCKGFSGLLGKETAATRKYQALNRLTFRGVFLTMEAWKDDPPNFIFFENVKGLATRGKKLLQDIRRLLEHYGYIVHHEHYDCGEWGGLAQHRRRFKLFARHKDKTSSPVYNPPKQRVRAISEVLEQMPLPWDPDNPPADLGAAGGPMHKLSRLTFKTQKRLALIPPGGDWRDLNRVQPGEYSIVPVPWLPKTFEIVRTAELQQRPGYQLHVTYDREPRSGVLDVMDSTEPSHTVTKGKDSNGNMLHVAEHRAVPITGDLLQSHMAEGETFPHKYSVQDMDESADTVTGARMGSGMAGVAEHRAVPITERVAFAHTPMGNGKGAGWVQDTNDPSGTITGDPGHRKSGGASIIAEHRVPHQPRDGSHQVGDMSDPSGPVLGAASVTSSNGIGAVAEYRHRQGKEAWNNMLRMTSWDDVLAAVTAATGPNQSASLVADPRTTWASRNGTMAVTPWDEASFAVLGAGDMHTGGAAGVADPRPPEYPPGAVWDCRIPDDDERGVWYIISPHRDKKGRRCWHRPLSTLELLAIQGFPWRHEDGRPVVLDGRSDRSWRERIGNAYPPPAMRALMEQILYMLLASETRDYRMDVMHTGILVTPPEAHEVA